MIQTEQTNSVLVKKVFIELFGTLGITYLLIWSKIFSDLNQISVNELSLASALAYIVFTLIGLRISGGHYNPAITISMTVLKQINLN